MARYGLLIETQPYNAFVTTNSNACLPKPSLTGKDKNEALQIFNALKKRVIDEP